MKPTIILAFALLTVTACGPSGTAMKEMEKFSGTPTPTFAPASPTPTPVDPADVVQTDTSIDGPTLSSNDYKAKATLKCDKYNLVRVNGEENTITVTGSCKQITVNGNKNTIVANAASEFALTGDSNRVTYSRYVNGKQPNIVRGGSGNEIEYAKAVAAPKKK